MAHYAYISNTETTVEERKELMELEHQRMAIIDVNTSSDEYQALLADYNSKNSSATLEALEAQMQALSVKGTETVDKQIQDKNEEISKIPSVVTHVCGGLDETITEVYDNTPDLEQEIKRNSGSQDVKRTSYNTRAGVHQLGGTPFRKNYAGKGMLYDPVRDAFYHPSPYPSWILDEDTAIWQPPKPRPEGKDWYWKEDTTEWVDYYWELPKYESPYPSWVYNGTEWIPPVPFPGPSPEENSMYEWNEKEQKWELQPI